jgi:hypothetical protein
MAPPVDPQAFFFDAAQGTGKQFPVGIQAGKASSGNICHGGLLDVQVDVG